MTALFKFAWEPKLFIVVGLCFLNSYIHDFMMFLYAQGVFHVGIGGFLSKLTLINKQGSSYYSYSYSTCTISQIYINYN